MNINRMIYTALEYHRNGDLSQAEILYKRILKKQPDNVDILHMLGLIYAARGDFDSAVRLIKKTININPSNYHAFYNLANIYRDNKCYNEAIDCYQKAINYYPDFVDAFYNLGVLYQEIGRLNDAIKCYQKAIQINPNLFNVHFNLGNAFYDMGFIEEAIISYRNAIKLNPRFTAAYYNLANILKEREQNDEAIILYKKALQLEPANIDLYHNIGILLHNKGLIEEAIKYYKKAISLNYNLAEIHFDLAFALLSIGNFEEGWIEYQWRTKLKNHSFEFKEPEWEGTINDCCLLLYEEQGFGDTIQFVRYCNIVANKGVKIVLLCSESLKSIMENVKGIAGVYSYKEQLPEFDFHCTLSKLPLIFRTDLNNIPSDVPYISVAQVLINYWRNKLNSEKHFKVGLTWAGNPEHENDKNRSCPLEKFLPLFKLKNVEFYSLQVGASSLKKIEKPEGINIIDLTEDIKDFSDTAALIENLDLVISVDTVIVHLAGALGKKVWTLLPFSSDWRWMINRDDSPWYPTMKLFRQPKPGDWDSVIEMVYSELSYYINNSLSWSK